MAKGESSAGDGADALHRSTSRKAAPLPSVPAATPDHTALEAAPSWLERIDQLARRGAASDALAEWRRFRLAYPNYPVPEELAARIGRLKE